MPIAQHESRRINLLALRIAGGVALHALERDLVGQIERTYNDLIDLVHDINAPVTPQRATDIRHAVGDLIDAWGWQDDASADDVMRDVPRLLDMLAEAGGHAA